LGQTPEKALKSRKKRKKKKLALERKIQISRQQTAPQRKSEKIEAKEGKTKIPKKKTSTRMTGKYLQTCASVSGLSILSIDTYMRPGEIGSEKKRR